MPMNDIKVVSVNDDETLNIEISENLKCKVKSENHLKDMVNELKKIFSNFKYIAHYYPRETHLSKFLRARSVVDNYNLEEARELFPKKEEVEYVTYIKNEPKIVKGIGLGNYVAFRSVTINMDGDPEQAYSLDSIVTGNHIIRIKKGNNDYSRALEKFQKFADILSKRYQLSDKKVVSLLVSNKETLKEIRRIMVDLFKNKEDVKLDDRVFREFQYSLYKELLNDKPDPETYDEEFERQRKQMYVETMMRLDEMVGLSEVKEQFESLYKRVIADSLLRKEGIEPKSVNNNALFLGNSGTGKTVVARMYADILWSLGVANEERMLVEVSREDLISKNIGGSEEKTEAFLKKAEGGVFFLDEAYALFKEGGVSDYGEEILTAILRKMENDRNNTVFVLAGYEKEMLDLLSMNQGLESRMNRKYIFNDYSIKELSEIIISRLKDANFTINGCERQIEALIREQSTNGAVEGNARTARNIAEKIFNVKRDRIADGLSYNHSEIDVETIEETRYGRDGKSNLMKDFEIAKQDLENLVGLKKIKNEVNNWVNSIMIKNLRFERGMNTGRPNLHMTFEGNPGTGKTIVARLVGRILKSSGILKQGQVVEVSRAELVGRYQGHTATNTKRAFERARGGVLFIDEAYSLMNNERDSFGKEAIDTIIQEMENNRENMVVIFAGYPQEMEEFIGVNPGMRSRISKRFHFEDYNSSEIFEIVDLVTKNDHYNLGDGAKEEIVGYIERRAQNGHIKGNGRWAREFVEKLIVEQNNRIMQNVISITDEELIEIEAIDVVNVLNEHYRSKVVDFKQRAGSPTPSKS